MASSNYFAQAVDGFIDHLQKTENIRSRFYQEVLQEASKLRYYDGADKQSSLSSQALQSYIESLDKEQTRHGKTRWIGKKLQPLITGLMRFTDAMDTMIQAGPAPALLVYGSAKLILNLATDFMDCFDKTVDAMRDIGELLECYHIFSKTYSSDDAMRHVLVDTYKNILIFWQRAAKLFTRNGVKTFLIGVVKPFDSEWETLRSRLERDRIKVLAFAQALEGSAAKRREQQTHERHIRSWLSGFDETAQIDVRMDLEPIQEARHVGTCEWIFSNCEYQRWLTSPENDNLWLHANPGVGKSVLCSTVVERLQSEGKKVAYFFCFFQEPQKRRVTNVLRSLALQLLSLHEDMPTDVEQIFEYEARHGQLKLQNPSIIVRVLQALIKSLDRIHIVIDGLDECEDHLFTTKLLLECFKTPTFGIVKWFWASRIELDFQRLASHSSARLIHIQKPQVETDIKKVIENSPEMAGGSHKSVDEWVVASEGNFLWLTIMLRTLTGCDLTCPAEVEEELGRFPKGLTECYQRVLDQLAKRSRTQRELARRLFLLVAFAEQPLTLHETLDALSIDEDSNSISSDRKPFEDLVKQLCCPLILVDSTAKNGRHEFVLRFFHKSTRDFFLHDPADLNIADGNKAFFATPEQGHFSMSKICMAYLSDERYKDPRSLDPEGYTFVDENGFLRYAALFWHIHFSRVGYNEDLFQLTVNFLRSTNFWSCMRVRAIVAPYLFSRLRGKDDSFYMIKPDHVDASDEGYFASPLPDWLESSEAGSVILQAYLLLVREWNPILLRQPKATLYCHPGALGQQETFATEVTESLGCYFAGLKPSDNLGRQRDFSPRNPHGVQILGTQPTKSGLRVFSLERSPEVDPTNAVLTQWHVNLDNKSSKKPPQFKQKQAWDVKASIELPYLQLRSERTVHEPVVWSFDIGKSTLSVYRAGKIFHFSPPPDIQQSCLNVSQDIASGHQTLCDVKEQCHHYGHTLVFFISWKVSLQTAGSETDDDLEEFGDSDSDASEDTSNSTQRRPLSQSRDQAKSDHDTCYGLVVAIDGVNDPVWGSWESTSESIRDFVPGYSPSESLLIWPVARSLVQCVSLETRISQMMYTPALDAATKSHILLRDLRFSKCGTTLFCLTVTYDNDQAAQHSIYKISLERLTIASPDTGVITLKEVTPRVIPITTMYTTPSSTSLAKILRHWTDDWVHLAINTTSSMCTVRLLKLPLLTTQSMDQPSPQTFPETIYVPASFAMRSPKFEVLNIFTEEHIVFVLQSSTANRHTRSSLLQSKSLVSECSTEAKASSADALAVSLPPIMITYLVSHLGGWQPWNAERDSKEPGLNNETDFSEYLKGNYAAADQRFSVPIRSGLNWRKAGFVSCW